MVDLNATPMSLLGDGCAFCHDQEAILILVEIPGFLSGFACEVCLRVKGKYCTTHNEMHVGFIDGTSSCRKCISDSAEINCEKAREFLQEVRTTFPRSEIELLNDLLEPIARALPYISEELLFSHWIATLAMRRAISFENVIFYIRSEIELSGILPALF